MCFGAVAALQAQDTTSISDDQYQNDDMNQGQGTSQAEDDSQEIAVSELPAAIQQQLQTQDYSGWTVSKAHQKMKDGETIYKVELTRGDEEKKVKFDAQGNELKDKDKDKDKGTY